MQTTDDFTGRAENLSEAAERTVNAAGKPAGPVTDAVGHADERPDPNGARSGATGVALLEPCLSAQELLRYSPLALAYAGDCVYELLVRTWLMEHEHSASLDLHRSTVAIVNAKAQAAALQKLLPVLTEEELAVFRRGRNAKVNSVPQKATTAEYHAATGLEALFGWLYLGGRRARVQELFLLTRQD